MQILLSSLLLGVLAMLSVGVALYVRVRRELQGAGENPPALSVEPASEGSKT